jgi:quinoprotein glucose dehydrogenase
VALASWSLTGVGQTGAKNNEWPAYRGDEASTAYSPADLITKDNVKNLQVAWTWKFDNYGGAASETLNTETTPLMVNGVLYFTAGARRTVVAAKADTGETLWTWRPDEGARFDQAPRKVHRGVAYWTDGRDAGRIVVVTPGFQLVALDAKTGQPVPGFGKAGMVDLFTQLDNDTKLDPTGKIGNSSPPVISNDVIVVGPALTPAAASTSPTSRPTSWASTSARQEAVDVPHHSARRRAGRGNVARRLAAVHGNAGIWGPFSADPQLGYVYLSVESATNDVYGGHRPGNNLYSDSIVCLDIKTGKMVWYQQLVHHDIWDFDMPPAGILIDLTVDGKPVKAIVQLTKQAFAYVFDRTNGKPVWPWNEKPVIQTKVPKEWTSPTQPFPSKPPAFDLQGITENDLIDFTPALRAEAVKAVQSYTLGPIFTPPTLASPTNKGTIQVPGLGGGANWPGGASDPETGFVYVGSTTTPGVVGLEPNTDHAKSRVDSDYTMGGQLPTIQGLRPAQAAVRPHHRLQHEQGRDRLDDSERRHAQAVKDNPALKGVTIPRPATRRRRACS